MLPTRRNFLKATLGASTLLSFGPIVPSFLGRLGAARAAGPDRSGAVLVVVQLTGGNDGLNTVVPFEDDGYARSRRTLRLSADQVLKVVEGLGFHPEMEALLRLSEKGNLCVVQGVGYPRSSRDHDGALRDWHTAMPGVASCRTGWLGRSADRLCPPGESDVPLVFVGPIERPFGLNAEKAVIPSFKSISDCALRSLPGPGGEEDHRGRLLRAAEATRAGGPLERFLQRSTRRAHEASRRIEAAGSRGAKARYPEFKLADALRTVACLIRAEAGIRIFFVELGGGGIGGFDSHANQGANHGALLRQLSESVAAFIEDLRGDGHLDRVLLMTFSEFGRTVAENGRRGTDHGAAAPLFLAGGKLKSGLVGPHPSLTDLEEGGMKFHTDFRRVYATVLERWLGFESRDVLGGEFEPMDLFRA